MRKQTDIEELLQFNNLSFQSVLPKQSAMPKAILNSVAIAVVCCGLSGCCLIGPRAHHGKLAASQLRSQELFAENEQLMLAQQNAQQTIGALEQERQMLSQQLVPHLLSIEPKL